MAKQVATRKDASLQDFKDLDKNLTSVLESDELPPELMKRLEEKLPPWVKELEADGTAAMRWNQELFILFEYILQRDFNFSDDDIDKFILKFKQILPVVHQMKIDVPRLLDKKDFHIAREMVERNKFLYKAERSGIALPNKQETKKLT